MRGVIVCVLVAVAGCGGVPDKKDEARGKAGERRAEKAAVVGLVEVGVLNHLYHTNGAAAEEKYADRRMTCLGYVYNVVKRGDEYLVHFVNPGEDRRIGTRAIFPAPAGAKLAKLEKYSPVRFKALCAGWNKTDFPAVVDLVECEVVPITDPAK